MSARASATQGRAPSRSRKITYAATQASHDSTDTTSLPETSEVPNGRESPARSQ